MSTALDSRGLGMQYVLIIEAAMVSVPMGMLSLKQKWDNLTCYK